MSSTVRRGLLRELRDLLADAEVGSRLPGERDLAARFGVARMSIRRALDDLEAEQLVVRAHGSGTYAAPRPFARLLGMTSFTQDMRQRGLVPQSTLVAFGLVPAGERIASELKVAPTAKVVRFTRLRLGSGEPMALETVWIPSALVPGVKPTDLDDSLYVLLARRYRIRPVGAHVRIEPVLPERKHAELLGIGPRQACLCLRMIDFDVTGSEVMAADCLYRGDRYQLAADVNRNPLPRSAVRGRRP